MEAFVQSLVMAVVSVLLPPTIVLFMLRVFLPSVGGPLWRAWGQLLGWLLVAPIRLVKLLFREATGRRRH